jgi:hypothetical protein
LPEYWKKEEPDRFGELTVTTYETRYAVDSDESHITSKIVETTNFKVNHTRKSQRKNQDGN